MNPSMPLISIIIPVYNAESTISRCVDSILRQSFSNFEIVLVNDGSKDSSGWICQDLSARYPNIKTLQIVNGGACNARWKGVEVSEGQWIYFADADDELPETALAILADHADGCDVVIGTTANPKGRVIVPHSEQILTPRQWVQEMIDFHILSGPWGKLIKREILDKAVFNLPRKFVYGEDMACNFRIATRCNAIKVVSDPTYIYYPNTIGSVSRTFKFTIDYARLSYEILSVEMTAVGCPPEYLDALYLKLLRQTLESGCFSRSVEVKSRLKSMDSAMLRNTRKGSIWHRILLSDVLCNIYSVLFRIKGWFKRSAKHLIQI